MVSLIWFSPMTPAVVAALCVIPQFAGLRRFSGIISSSAVLGAGLCLVAAVSSGQIPTTAGGLLRADALSSYMLVVIGAVGLTATWGGLRRSDDPERFPRAYAVLVSAFLTAMDLAVLADNLGVMWVAVEATTIATAFLVGHHRTRQAVEAAWKYVVLGSVGVAIAFLGIVLLYAATRAAGHPTLSWIALISDPPRLDPSLARLALALTVLGLATKAGLAPMHSWLPDAHSQAPAPVSGLMSGVLLSVAFYGILRVQAISDLVIGEHMMREFLTVAGLLSLTVSAALIMRQRDYKRLLAYSSVEHMGLLAIGAAIGSPLALGAVLLHMLGHGLGKATLFVLAGRILAATGSTRIVDVKGLLSSRPALGAGFLTAMVALLGFPPFALFISEVALVIAGWKAGMGAVMGATVVLVLLIFTGLVRHTVSLTLEPEVVPTEVAALAGTGARSAMGLQDGSDRKGLGPSAGPVRRRAIDRVTEAPGHHGPETGPNLPLILALLGCAVAGFSGPLGTVIAAAAAVLGGTR